MKIQKDIDKEIKKSAKFFLYSLIDAIDDYDELMRMLEDSSPGSDLEKQLELRMTELNNVQLPKITDYDELMRRLKDSSPGSDLEKQLELAIEALIHKEKVSLIKAFKEGVDAPDFLKETLKNLAKRLLKN